LDLAYLWFCRLGLDDDVSDRSMPRELFDTTVRRCVEEDLVCVKDLPSIRA
jgi:hypothetical protein